MFYIFHNNFFHCVALHFYDRCESIVYAHANVEKFLIHLTVTAKWVFSLSFWTCCSRTFFFWWKLRRKLWAHNDNLNVTEKRLEISFHFSFRVALRPCDANGRKWKKAFNSNETIKAERKKKKTRSATKIMKRIESNSTTQRFVFEIEDD